VNFCAEGGYLIDGTFYFYPDDPCEYTAGHLPIRGCNHIVCPSCGETVRQKVVGENRSYACRCHRWEEKDRHRLDETDPLDGDPRLPWRCAGHPLVTLPHDFDGVSVDEAGLAALVARALGGWTPQGVRKEDRERAGWVLRLDSRLRGTPHTDVVEAAVVAGLDGADAAARGRALNFIEHVQIRSGLRRVVELLRGDRGGFAGVPDTQAEHSEDKTLEDSLWRVARFLPETAEALRELSRTEASSAGRGTPALFNFLAYNDKDWLAEHVTNLARATPAALEALGSAITLISDRKQAEQLIAAAKAAVAQPA
jgi:hypothetical protein